VNLQAQLGDAQREKNE
jgi:chromosome segregation ATPase